MASKVIMPKAGMAMEEGTIIRWFKYEGDTVEKGEPILEIETDKVNMEVESMDSGILLKVIGQEGDTFAVTETIAYIGEEDEDIESLIESSKTVVSEPEKTVEDKTVQKKADKKVLVRTDNRVPATPVAKKVAREQAIDLSKLDATGIYGEIRLRDVLAVDQIKATPLARRIAEDNNIDLATVKGTGHAGKIVKEDIMGLLVEEQEPVVTEQAVEGDRMALTGMRKVIAERMTKSHQEIPSVTMDMKADVGALSKMRKQLNQLDGVKLSYNDFIMKACALTLVEMPMVNSSIEGNEIVLKKDINVGMAVALEEGLIVPVIKNADELSMKVLSGKSKELAQKARDGKLAPDEYTGGTFTVSNLGMYNVSSFTPIINQPESAILGVCALEKTLKLVDGQVTEVETMNFSLTFDHRVIDGAQGALFLRRMVSLLENPMEMLL